MGDNAVLEGLSKKAGVDFVALKEKYSNIQNSVNAHSNHNQTNATEDFEKLNKYKICSKCQGLGIVKSIYNHRVMESECDECEGDAIIDLEKLVATVREKIQ